MIENKTTGMFWWFFCEKGDAAIVKKILNISPVGT
jgi:hypothetical protein